MVSPSNIVLMCEICDKMFATKEELKEHKTVHDEMPVLKAENGTKEEEEKQDLSKKYSCTICNKHYLGYGGLWDHNKKKHPGRQIAHDYPRKCKFCDKLLYTGGSWVIHKRMHERLMQQEQNMPSTSHENSTPKSMKAPPSDEDQEEAESYHTCKRCFKVFSSKYNLKNHMKCHGINLSPSRSQSKNNKQVWCDVCHQACPSPAELEVHKREHENENMGEIITEEDEEIELVKPQIYVCDLCDQHLMSKAALRKHKEQHAEELTKMSRKADYVFCKYCKIPFSDNEALNEHMIDEHDETLINPRMKESQNKRYPCNYCRKTFDTAGALCSHQGWHKRGKAEKQLRMQEKLFKKMSNNVAKPVPSVPIFQCHRCNAEFSNDTALQIHILEKHRNVNATVVLPRCTQCNVEFDSTEAYDKHKQLHLIVEKKKEMKQHPCKYCSSAFSRSDTLTAHVKQHHREFFAKHFKCHVCDRLFEKQNALTIHLKTHERQRLLGQPPKPLPKGLSCSICQIVFSDSKELRNHVFTAHPF